MKNSSLGDVGLEFLCCHESHNVYWYKETD